MTCPSKKSLLVYCFFILLPNRTIIATTNIRKRVRTMAYEDKKETDLRPSAADVVKSMALTKIDAPSDCMLWNGQPGKCFPPESCFVWDDDVSGSRMAGYETRWPVCEWLHQPLLFHRRHPEVLVVQRQQPLTVCCRDPQLRLGKSSIRQIIRSFVEIPGRQARLNQRHSNARCGLSVPSIESHFHPLSKRRRRMVSGHSTSSQDFPWMAAIFVKGQFTCGGSILSDRVVITTAHCLSRRRNVTHEYGVMVGSTDLGSGTMYQVLKVVRHPDFEPESVMNDVALVFTFNPIVFNNDVNPICFPPPSMDAKAVQGLAATMTGFGTYYYGGPLPMKLQETRVPIRRSFPCFQMLRGMKLVGDREQADSLICTGFQNSRTDSCQGDSGGPLTIKVSDSPSGGVGRSYLIGIISAGYKCNTKGYFGISIAVAPFSQWIHTVMKIEADSIPFVPSF